MRMDTPLPPASIWEQFPEISIIILVALALTAAFVFYSDRREKSWQKFIAEQREASEKAQKAASNTQTEAYDKMLQCQQCFWNEQRADDRRILTDLTGEIKKLREDHQDHDEKMIEAISKMEERTRPARKRSGAA